MKSINANLLQQQHQSRQELAPRPAEPFRLTTSSQQRQPATITSATLAKGGPSSSSTTTTSNAAVAIAGKEDTFVDEMHRPQLSESLESIQKADFFPAQRHRWSTNEEIASIVIVFEKHEAWLSKEVKIRPKSGSMLLYSRKRVRYRRDGYCWKKRKDGKTTREDHMKLKVHGTECIYGCYVHSAILPTFHRRCYWLLQNPDIVLVHYLNVPYMDSDKIVTPTLNYFADSKKEWTKEELICELMPMFFSENDPDLNNELELSMAETLDALVQQLMAKQRAKVKALEEASDIGINARALTVAAAVSNSAKDREASKSGHHQLSSGGQSAKEANNKNCNNQSAKRQLIQPNTCIITTPSNHHHHQQQQTPGHHRGTQGSVQLVQLANGTNATAHIRQAGGGSVATSGVGQTPSLIFNLSQLQNGNGILILNSAGHSPGSTTICSTADTVTGTHPMTLLYSRANSTSSSSSSSGQANNQHFQNLQNGLRIKTQQQQQLQQQQQQPMQDFGVNCNSLNIIKTESHSTPSGFDGLGSSSVAMDVANGNVATTTNFGPNSSLRLMKQELVDGQLVTGRLNCDDVPLRGSSSASSVSNSPHKSNADDESEECEMVLGFSPPFSRKNLVVIPGAHRDGRGAGVSCSSLDQVGEVSAGCGGSVDKINQLSGTRGHQQQANQQQQQQHHQQSSNNSMSSSSNSQGGSHAFEQLSHDDMGDPGDLGGLNHMDFIDNDIANADDFFSNIEAFDEMLTDIHSLDDLNTLNASPFKLVNNCKASTSSSSTIDSSCGGAGSKMSSSSSDYVVGHSMAEPSSTCSSSPGDFCESSGGGGSGNGMATISDYSPEWSYADGGMKVLVAGPWNLPSAQYTILFDGLSVATELVQHGVLRCRSPARAPGLAGLQVAIQGCVVSNSVPFEFREHPTTPSLLGQEQDSYNCNSGGGGGGKSRRSVSGMTGSCRDETSKLAKKVHMSSD